MTVLRLADGQLILHSPIPISAGLREALEGLGLSRIRHPSRGQVETLPVLGFRLREVVLFHRPSRTLLMTDLCFNIQRSSSTIGRLFFWANGMWQVFGPSRIVRQLGVSNRAALRRSLARVRRWDFDRIVPGHGEVIEHGGPAALAAAWSI